MAGANTKCFNVFEYSRAVRATKNKILSSTKKLILITLADHFRNDGEIFPTNQSISNETGLEIKTVKNKLSELKSEQYLDYQIQRNNRRRYIQLFDPITKNLLVPVVSPNRDTGVPKQGPPIYYKRAVKDIKLASAQIFTKIPDPPFEPKPAAQPLSPAPKTDLTDEIKAEVKDSGISEKAVINCQQKFNDGEYTLTALQIAKTKNFPGAYFRFLSNDIRESVIDRIAAKKEAEAIKARVIREQQEFMAQKPEPISVEEMRQIRMKNYKNSEKPLTLRL